MDALPVASPWFTHTEVEPDIVLLTEPHVARLWRANMFLVRGRDRDLLVDSGMGVGDLRAAIAPWVRGTPLLFTTHSHLDHIGGHAQFADAEILVHPLEAARLRDPGGPPGLAYAGLSPARTQSYRDAGFSTDGLFIDAVPRDGYNPAAHRFHGVEATRMVEAGEVIDLGSRRFEVLHLPGHSPGGVALWEAGSGTLIAGDVIYDGILIDTTADASVPDYLDTMARLRALPVRVVHGGHKGSFGRERMMEIIDGYVTSRHGPRQTRPEATVTF